MICGPLRSGGAQYARFPAASPPHENPLAKALAITSARRPGPGVRRALPEKRAGRWFLLEPIPSGPPSESVRAIGSKAADVIEMRLSQQPHPCFSSAGSSKDSIALRFR
jgi:hypothetical protein